MNHLVPIDPRIRCSPAQMVAAKELIQAFLYAIDTQPEARDFNYAIIVRVAALLRGEVPVADVRDDQLVEALTCAEMVHQQTAGKRQ
jgi:hypothetical protein